MEQNVHDQKLQNVDKFMNKKYMNKFLKRTLQSVISISLFSLFLCYSSGFCFFPHSFIVYFSAFLFSLFTHTLQRRFIFLICNGILAILAKSVLSCGSSPSVVTENIGGDFSVSDVFAMSKTSVAEEVQVESIGSVDNYVSLVAEGGEDEEKVAEVEKLESHEDGPSSGLENEQREIEAFIADQNEGGGEEEEVPPEANDELNKKFEEFIRKMKEEIKIEAQHQLIAV